MKRIALFSVAVLVVAVTAACERAVGCDFRNGSLNGPEDRCQERAGIQSTGFDGACVASGGEVVDGDDGCPTEGIVGGCDLGQGVIDWYYEPTTQDELESNCGSDTVLDAP